MRTVLRAFVIAFSMYSKIPMPHVEWEEKSMRYALCFFPCIGAVLGLVMAGINLLLVRLGLGTGFRAAILTVVPVWVTGGIHMDGYMDTMDAMSSYQPTKRRLEILKDSHVGAFAVMSALCYFFLFFGCMTELGQAEELLLFGACLVVSRAMSALSFVTCPSAKKDGLQRTFADAMQKKAVAFCSVLYLVLSFAVCFYTDTLRAGMLMAAVFCLYLYYKRFSAKNFGGITGDLAGYYLQLQELVYLMIIVTGFN